MYLQDFPGFFFCFFVFALCFLQTEFHEEFISLSNLNLHTDLQKITSLQTFVFLKKEKKRGLLWTTV